MEALEDLNQYEPNHFLLLYTTRFKDNLCLHPISGVDKSWNDQTPQSSEWDCELLKLVF
jgi:hypothetical protein